MKLKIAGLFFAILVAGTILHSGEAIGFRGFRFEGLPDPPATRLARAPSVGWITQRVDHFNPRDNRTWSMRYYENDQFVSEPDAPILIMLGGEWAIGTGWLQTGQMYDIASTHGAMMYYTEHRYYGQSYPTSDMSSKNLQYLNVEQALADVAYFIEAMKKERNLENSKVIVFGGSYAGNMAAWARIKYPHLIQGALASSAPILAKADFYEYYEVVTEALSRHNPQCIVEINQAFEQIEILLRTALGRAALKSYFNLCFDIDASSSQDVGSFVTSVSQYFAGLVQYDAVDSTGESYIAQACNIMTGPYLRSSLERLAWLVRGTGCLNVNYKSVVETYGNTEWGSFAATSAMRPWYYQTCTEYGYYQTSSSDVSVFGSLFPIDYYIELCSDLYGSYYNEKLLNRVVNRTNIIYGGWTPDVTNVIFTNGDIDPWHVLSVLEDLNESSPAIVVDGASHCQDLYSDSATDSREMLVAKARVRQIVGEWIS